MTDDFGITKNKKRRKKSVISGGPFAGLPTPGSLSSHEVVSPPSPRVSQQTTTPVQQQPVPPSLKHGVEGYVPEKGTVARLDPDIEADIVANIQGPIDATLANLTKAHLEVFNSLPSWSLTADILDSGEIEFPTYEEALRFFQNIKRSYAASGKEWMLDAQTTNAGLLSQRERQKGLEGFGPETDVLDPEMIASFNPKRVEDFLLGPYMKKSDKNRVSGMYRQGRLRLDDMLIEVPKQWAISNLSNRLSARAVRFNPDRDEDEAMMQELNEFLADRVPAGIAPGPTAAWQTKTEEALRFLQMMRASAIYMATGGEDDDAAGFLRTQGYSKLITTLEEDIRLPADQTGRTDEARRRWVQDFWVRSRNPGISERMAVHQLADLNIDMVTIEGQRQIGYDHLNGYAGAIKGFVGGVPGAEQIGDIVTSDEFQRVVGPAVAFAGDIVETVKPMVMVPVTMFAEVYEFYDKYADAFQSAVRAADDSVLATMLKPLVLPFGFVGLIPGQPEGAKQLSGTDVAYSSLWSEFFTQVFKQDDADGIEFVGDFVEKFKDNLKRREQGLPADYASEVLADMGVNPLTHPEVAFLATFTLDTVRDFGIAKVAGIASTAIRGTETFKTGSDLARTTLHQESVSQMVVRKFKESIRKPGYDVEDLGPFTKAPIGQMDKNSFVRGVSELFGWRGDQVADLGRALRKAQARGATDDELLQMVRKGIDEEMAKSGKFLRADTWGLSYRMREKALLDPNSPIYRGKHPIIAGWFERLWSSNVLPVNDDRLPDATRQLGFSYRNSLSEDDILWSSHMDRAMLHEFGDLESINELERIAAARDIPAYAGFMEGLYADSRHLAERGLRLAGEVVNKDTLEAATVKLRERIAKTFGWKVGRHMLLNGASKRFSKKIWQKDPKAAQHWNALARAVDPNKKGDFVPLGLEYEVWNGKKSFKRGVAKGETAPVNIAPVGFAEGLVMAPEQGAPTIKRQLVEGGPEVTIPNEQSVALLYGDVEPMVQAYRDLIGLDPDSGMPPGVIQEMAKLEGRTVDEVDLEIKAVDAAHQTAFDNAVTKYAEGIAKTMREKGSLDEQLELFNALLAQRDKRMKELANLKAAGASRNKVNKAARAADKSERELHAARIELVRSKLHPLSELRQKTKAKAEEVRAMAAERQGIKERLGHIQNRIAAGLRTESQEPELMGERVLLVESEQNARRLYDDALSEKQHWDNVINLAETLGILETKHVDAWKMAASVARERQASWRLANERMTNARIAQQQGVYTGEGRPRIVLRFYEPDQPTMGTMVDETLPAAKGGGTITPGRGKETTPLDTAFNVDLPDSDLAALDPPPWVQEEFLMVLRRYGDLPAIRVLQEWLSEQLYGYSKKLVDEDPRVVYSREQIAELTTQMTDAGYPVPPRPTGGIAPTPRTVKAQPSRSVTPEQLLEEVLVEREKVKGYLDRAVKSWLDAYEEHRLIYRDVPGQTTMRGIREAENMLMERKTRPVSLREPVQTIGTSMRTAVSTGVRRSDKELVPSATPYEPVRGISQHPVTYAMPKQRGMRESVRRTEIYFDSVRRLDQRLKALDARIAGLKRRTAPYYEPNVGEVRPPTPAARGTGTEAERIATEQAGPIMERGAVGRKPQAATEKMKQEAGYEGLSEDEAEILADTQTGLETRSIINVREGEVEIPPNQHFHDTLARLAAIGYLRGQVTIRVPMLKVVRTSPGTSPPSIVDAERWLTEAKLGARKAGEPFPLTTEKEGVMRWHRVPEYETFTETTGRGKNKETRTYTRVKRDENGDIVWKVDDKGQPVMEKGRAGGARRMDPEDLMHPRRDVQGQKGLVSDDPRFRGKTRVYMESERPLQTGAQGPRFEAHEMRMGTGWQMTQPAEDVSLERWTDMSAKYGGRILADPAQKTIYAPGYYGDDMLALFDALVEEGIIDHTWVLSSAAAPEGLAKGALISLHQSVAAERKFYHTYAELLSAELERMFRDGRNAPVVANLSADLAERAALRAQQLGKIEVPEFAVTKVIRDGNVADTDFTVIFVSSEKELAQVKKATVRGGGPLGKVMRDARRANKDVTVIEVHADDVAEQIRNFLSGKRGALNVVGENRGNASRIKDALDRAIRGETTEAPAPTNSFEIVAKGQGDFDGMRARGKNITNAKPGEPGALGNPFVAKDAGGKLTREEATAKFEEVFLARVESDPEFKAWVLSLRGKKIGYYKPGEDVIHLHVVQRWLEKQPTTTSPATAGPALRGVPAGLEGPFSNPLATKLVDEAKPSTVDKSKVRYDPNDSFSSESLLMTYDRLTELFNKITKAKRLSPQMRARFEELSDHLAGTPFPALRPLKEGEEYNDVTRFMAAAWRRVNETDEVAPTNRERLVVHSSAKGEGGILSNFWSDYDRGGFSHDENVTMPPSGGIELSLPVGDMDEMFVTFPTVEHAYQFFKIQYGYGQDEALKWFDTVKSKNAATAKQSAGRYLRDNKGVSMEGWERGNVNLMRRLLREKFSQSQEARRALLATGDRELVHEGRGIDSFWGIGRDGKGQNMHGKLLMEIREELRADEVAPTGRGKLELNPVEAGALSADELSEAAVPRADPELVATNAAASVAHTAARSAEYRFLRAQRELRQLELELHAAEQDIIADLARIRGGTARPLTNEDVENLRLLLNWIDGGLSPEKFMAEVGKEMDESIVNSAAHTLWLLQHQPDQALRWAVQPSREWQLLLWADLGYNPARLAKFLRGGATRRMESVWANKWAFKRWSVDDAVTLYKTIVMAKISTMLRITMADEFTRLFAEGYNPLVALGKAKALKALDKLPEDIQFKLSDMIGKAVQGDIVLFDINHPQAWMAYRHILVNHRRDATYTRYVWGKQLTAEERARQVDDFLATEEDVNFVKMVQDYREMGDEFRAWFALGYRSEQGLRRIGAASHRVVKTGDGGEMLTRQTDEYAKVHGPGQNQYGDARNLVDHIVQDYDWFTNHRLLGRDWRPSRRFTDDELIAFKNGDLRMPLNMGFGDKLRRDAEPSRRNWKRLQEEVRRASKLGEESQEQLKQILPAIWGVQDGSLTAGVPVVRDVRDLFYRILDYSGSKLNEMVYAEAFTAEKQLLMAKGMAEDLAERNAAFTAREYVHRVMFNNATYMGEDMMRNILLFLPAYRQFVQYWVPYLAKHPATAALAYRANRDKDQFKDMRVGPMSLDLSRMSFLINQGDNSVTGWLPSGGPIITMPVSYLVQGSDERTEDSIWGSLAGRWPLEYAGDGMPLHSPLDKVFYGLFGKTLPWPFGSNGDRNPWRELQIVIAAERKGQRISKDDAHWINRMNRLYEGGWNFVVPIGMRFINEDVQQMRDARRAYNNAKTPEEVAALLADPANRDFKTFIEWQNKPSWDQLQFLKEHPEILPYAVSGFEGRRTNERDIGFLWSKMADVGVADPAGYIDRIDEKVAMINRVIEALDARKARDDEMKWWNSYRKKHEDDHNIARLTFEWQNSEGAFAPGGIFYQQGRLGYAARNRDLNGRFSGLTDPFTGITPGDDFDNDSYRLAKFLDEAGGHAKALLQLSPNYEMYVLAKLQEHTAKTTEMLGTWKERRMATRMTPEDVRRAGYSAKDTETIMLAVKRIDELWDAADRAIEPLGKYGYATTDGRAIRKRAIEYQNSLIDSSPLLKEFLGDNITALYGKSYLTKPAYEREDLIRLDDMDSEEREAFYRLRERRDENGKPVWNGLFLPEGEKKFIEGGVFLGYVPTKQGWMTKIRVGEVVGMIAGKQPKEGKQIILDFERAKNLARSMQTAGEPTLEKERQWLAALKKSYPGWAKRLIEDAVRASCWEAWLAAAKQERHNLRTTINEYYSDAPGFSLNSKYGMRVKKNLLNYGKLLGQFEPTFKSEFSLHNRNNEMVNSILGWYL